MCTVAVGHRAQILRIPETTVNECCSMSSAAPVPLEPRIADLPIQRDHSQFLKELLRELSGVLEDNVGLDEAEGFISLVGGRIGQMMNREYCAALSCDSLTLQQVADVLVDLKSRIDGGFRIESIDETRIILVNSRCPFGRFVEGRESLCMMTSNVFGSIAATNLGYARVNIVEAFAKGDSRCRVVVDLEPGTSGREYYG